MTNEERLAELEPVFREQIAAVKERLNRLLENEEKISQVFPGELEEFIEDGAWMADQRQRTADIVVEFVMAGGTVEQMVEAGMPESEAKRIHGSLIRAHAVADFIRQFTDASHRTN